MNLFCQPLGNNIWSKDNNALSTASWIIDLDKPQVFDNPIPCWMGCNKQSANKKTLVAIVKLIGGDIYYVEEYGDMHEYCTLIDPTPKERLMTRNEVLTFIQNTPMKIRIRYLDKEWHLPQYHSYTDSIDYYEWMKVDARGIKIGQIHKFTIME